MYRVATFIDEDENPILSTVYSESELDKIKTIGISVLEGESMVFYPIYRIKELRYKHVPVQERKL